MGGIMDARRDDSTWRNTAGTGGRPNPAPVRADRPRP